jgi:cytochrome b involved in lipid metabolism
VVNSEFQLVSVSLTVQTDSLSVRLQTGHSSSLEHFAVGANRHQNRQELLNENSYQFSCPDKIQKSVTMWHDDANGLDQHNSEESCWIMLHGQLLDVTPWLNEHPGGKHVLLKFGGGKDATLAFDRIGHSQVCSDESH